MGVLAAGIGKATGLLSTSQAVGLGAGGLFGLAAGSLKPPNFPKPPSPPDPSQFLKPGGTALIGPGEGSFGGTFLGNNRAPNIAGGKKTLLGS